MKTYHKSIKLQKQQKKDVLFGLTFDNNLQNYFQLISSAFIYFSSLKIFVNISISMMILLQMTPFLKYKLGLYILM